MSFRPDIGQQEFHRFQRIIGHQDLVQIFPGDRTGGGHLVQHHEQMMIKGSPEDHDGKLIDHPGLDQGGGLKEFIHCSESSRKDGKPVRILEQHVFAHKKMSEGDPAMQVRIGFLFEG